MIRIKRKSHRRKGHIKDVRPGLGIRLKRIKPSFVDGTTFLSKDTGAPGRTPEAQRWSKGIKLRKLGWRKEQPAVTRRMLLAGVVRKRGLQAAVGQMNFLANISADPQTKILARSDVKWLSEKFKKR